MNTGIEEAGGTRVNAARLLALNNAHHRDTSLLDAARLDWMLGHAFRVEQVGDVAAFLIAFDQDAAYDSPNFLWLRERVRDFVYVDRVVTAPEHRGRGLAAGLYHRLFDQARQAGRRRVVCEVNVEPPNPASDAFHARLGFTEIGRQTHGQGKVVRFLEGHLDRPRRAGTAA